MSNHVYIATSLDGFIADRDGGLEWLDAIPNPEGSDWGFSAFMARIDAVVMGRITFETVLGFRRMALHQAGVRAEQHALSTSPPISPTRPQVMSGSPADVVASLNARGYRELYIDGGRTIQRFLEADLIDEMTISRVGVLLGGGVPLFGELSAPARVRSRQD